MGNSSSANEGVIGCIVFCIALVIFAVVMAVGPSVNVSDGQRDGVVQKFSSRGVVFKTWEGELAQQGGKFRVRDGNGSGGNVMRFSVNDTETGVIEAIKNLGADEVVRLHYRQQLASWPWQGETRYRIVRVERIGK